MQATQSLPTGYAPLGSVTLKENRRLLILLNVLGIPWFILCALFFFAMASLLSPANDASGSGVVSLSLTDMLLAFVVIVAALAAMLVLHEAVHGIFFWLFTRSRPLFAFKGLYAYAAAPGWFIPRWPFLVIGLAPLLLISLAGLVIMPFIAFPFSLVLILALIANATGAIGDLYLMIRLLFVPQDALIEDWGEGIRWFAPAGQE